MTPEPPSILVVGAFGAFGRILVRDLIKNSSCRVLAGGRGRSDMGSLWNGLETAERERLTPILCDLNDSRSIVSALTNAQAAVCAAGPFQSLAPTLLDACLERGIPYLDLADDRGFVVRSRELVNSESAPAGIGWSAAPALSGLLARLACSGFDSVEEIAIQIAPGARSPRGSATVSSLFDSLGKPFNVWDGGAWHRIAGWSHPRVFQFPPPIGPREGYLIDIADHELFPSFFGAARVHFRVGSEFAWQNRVCAVLAWLSRELAFEWAEVGPALSGLLGAFGRFGSDAGAVGVEVLGREAGRIVRRRACVVAPRGGEVIPILPAAVMAPRLSSGLYQGKGLVPVDSWLTKEELAAECAKRALSLSIAEVPA